MKCPKCKKEIQIVYVISEYTQEGILRGNKIIDYDDYHAGDDIGVMLRVECPKCNENITKFIKE